MTDARQIIARAVESEVSESVVKPGRLSEGILDALAGAGYAVLHREQIEQMEGRGPADDGRMLNGGNYLPRRDVLALWAERGEQTDA